ncbi:unnamed protein product [Candidula unifasciata]|uniref:RING-type domain-containing protein n=1 Tax=Candidula unifasciata TaxID=100452 RepID=A0A8S4A9B9_9EUPU|nr:unnamed protein product [Candidula unifasciata]
MSLPPHSSSTSQSSSLTAATSATTPSQSVSWSLQNFPVPLQLHARIPRSPLSVAQELLPNFPTNLVQQYSYSSPQQQLQQYQMSLQQRLQQQFQHQLQLNLQGGGESSGPVLPEPPDTILDMDLPGGGSGEGMMNSSSNNSGLRSQFLEALFRSAQSASSHQRSPNDLGGFISRGASGHSNSHSHGHHHHNYQSNESDGSGRFSSSTNGNGLGGPGVGMGPHGAGIGAGGTGVSSPGAARSDTGQPNGGIQQGAELTLLYRWIAESGIFIILLLLHFLYDHRLGLLVFLCLGGTFYYTNMKLVHSIHQSAVREQSRSWTSLLTLLWLCGFLILNIAVLYYVFSEQQLWKLLFFQMAVVADISVWTLLWCVVMTDYVIKFLTVIAKSLLAMMQPCSKKYRRRGKYYHLVEMISQLYRQAVTVVPWLYYLNDSTRTSVWFAFSTEAVYLGFKGWSIWGAVQVLYSSFQRFQSNTSFGTKPSSSDMLERGNHCPICQETVNEPVMLPCKHIFCEQCVSIWFDREKTCPMCRAEITAESPMWRDGNTSPHLQWH